MLERLGFRRFEGDKTCIDLLDTGIPVRSSLVLDTA